MDILKQTLDPLEVAFIACGLKDFDGFMMAWSANRSKGVSDSSFDHINLIVARLCEEIALIDQRRTGIDEKALEDTCLVIAMRVENDDGRIDRIKTRITRKSAAQWFSKRGHAEMARRLSPAFEQESIGPTVKLKAPESSLMDSLGILAYMLSETKNGMKWGENPNAKAIAEAIKDQAVSLDIELKEVSNLQKAIKEAVRKVAPKIKK